MWRIGTLKPIKKTKATCRGWCACLAMARIKKQSDSIALAAKGELVNIQKPNHLPRQRKKPQKEWLCQVSKQNQATEKPMCFWNHLNLAFVSKMTWRLIIHCFIISFQSNKTMFWSSQSKNKTKARWSIAKTSRQSAWRWNLWMKVLLFTILAQLLEQVNNTSTFKCCPWRIYQISKYL